MPLIMDIDALRKNVKTLVDKGKKNEYIENKLLEDGVSINQINELMFFVCFYRDELEDEKQRKLQEEKTTSKGMLIFWCLVVAVVLCIVLVTQNDNFFLEGAILATALHQIITAGIKLVK
jgi:hypothetical protein